MARFLICLHSPFNMPTMLFGSMSGFKEKSWRSQLAYWKRQLGTGLTTLNLPTDYERPAVQTYRGARLTKDAFRGAHSKRLKS